MEVELELTDTAEEDMIDLFVDDLVNWLDLLE